MGKEKYISLLIKQLKEEISEEEGKMLSDWIAADPKHQQLSDELTKDWEDSLLGKRELEVDVAADFAKFQERIQTAKQQQTETAKVVPLKKPRRQWLWIAASVALLFSVYTTLRWNSSPESIVLTAGISNTRTAELADGTKVWLNAKSKLTYPESFNGEERLVQLSGEAYFDVAKNADQPFIIQLEQSTVKVLGTAFNVYEDQKNQLVKVSVDEGTVIFAQRNGNRSVTLLANQSATYDLEEKVLEKDQQIDKNAAAWKTKTLSFEESRLEAVLQDVEKVFGRKVSLQNERLKECIFGAYFPKPDVDGVLSAIARAFDMQLVQDRNGNYQLNEGQCKEVE